MKKLVTLLLALSLVFTMAFSASAAVGQGTESQTITINLSGTGNDGTAADTLYYVDLTWANTTLTFTADNGEQMVEWDAANHVYKVIEGVTATGPATIQLELNLGGGELIGPDISGKYVSGTVVTLPDAQRDSGGKQPCRQHSFAGGNFEFAHQYQCSDDWQQCRDYEPHYL